MRDVGGAAGPPTEFICQRQKGSAGRFYKNMPPLVPLKNRCRGLYRCGSFSLPALATFDHYLPTVTNSVSYRTR